MTSSYRPLTPAEVAHLHEYVLAAKRELGDSEGMMYALEALEGAKLRPEPEPTREPRRGLRANVYRSSGGSSSNGGISSYADEVVVVGPGIPEIVTATDDMPAVEIGTISFNGETTYHLRPVEEPGKRRMFGGAFVHSTDTRFRKMFPFNGAVALHDRYEG